MPIEPLARYFEYWLLRLQGVYDAGMRMSDDARAFLDDGALVEPVRAGRRQGLAACAAELEAAHRELIAMHLEKDLKSVRVLKEMRR